MYPASADIIPNIKWLALLIFPIQWFNFKYFIYILVYLSTFGHQISKILSYTSTLIHMQNFQLQSLSHHSTSLYIKKICSTTNQFYTHSKSSKPYLHLFGWQREKSTLNLYFLLPGVLPLEFKRVSLSSQIRASLSGFC